MFDVDQNTSSEATIKPSLHQLLPSRNPVAMAMENVDVAMIGYIDQLPEECLSHVISLTTP
jgi:hypothetical protein